MRKREIFLVYCTICRGEWCTSENNLECCDKEVGFMRFLSRDSKFDPCPRKYTATMSKNVYNRVKLRDMYLEKCPILRLE